MFNATTHAPVGMVAMVIYNMAGRCGPICQHPGCWQPVDKQKIDKNKFTGYIEYLNNVVAKRKSRKVIEKPPLNDGKERHVKVMT